MESSVVTVSMCTTRFGFVWYFTKKRGFGVFIILKLSISESFALFLTFFSDI